MQRYSIKPRKIKCVKGYGFSSDTELEAFYKTASKKISINYNKKH